MLGFNQSMRKYLSLIAIVIFFVVFSVAVQLSVAIQVDTTIDDQNTDEKAFKKKLALQPLAQQIEINLFGHDLFKKDIHEIGFGNIVFPDNYLLGPGDQLGIILSGKIRQDFNVVVTAEGKIHVPTVGVFDVRRLPLNEFQVFLKKKLSQFYDNFHVDVILIEPKPVQVSVIGEVRQPGKYHLTALNTVIDALIMAGGPTQKGSLRDIRLYRDGRFIRTIDFYQFLIKPDQNDANYLEPGDRIFVPFMKTKVRTSGEFRRTKIFELKPGANEKMSDLLELAGGVTEYAYPEKVEVSRLQEDGSRRLTYISLNNVLTDSGSADNIQLLNEDEIHVFSKLEQLYPKVVHIHGEVKKPGEYRYEEDMRLSDLLLKAGNLTRSAYLLKAEVARVDPKKPTEFVKINLGQLLLQHDSSQDVLLGEDDRVFIRRIPEWEVGPIVDIEGEVMFPGTYSITEDNTTLSEILLKAGGFTDDALIRESKLVRKSAKIQFDKEYERLKQMQRDQLSESEYQYLVMKENTSDIGQIVVDFYKLMIENDVQEDVALEDNDRIIVPKKPDVVYVTGRVSKPGGIIYAPGQKLKYYLEKAGGVTWDSHVKKTKVTKVSGEILDDEDVKSFSPGDIIWVPRKPERNWWEFFRQTMIVITQFATLYLVIDRTSK